MAMPVTALVIGKGTVLLLITVVVLPIAALAFAGSGKAWRQIGKGRFAIEEEAPARRPGSPHGTSERAIQAAEARQMLEASSYRRVRRGQPALDVDAELRRVMDGEPVSGARAPDGGPGGAGREVPGRPDADPELRAEVRRLVIIRNERRVREGQPPLDVETETERQLADFIGSPG